MFAHCVDTHLCRCTDSFVAGPALVSTSVCYEELPLFLNAATVEKVLGIAPFSTYELMHEGDFPVLKVGSRMVVSLPETLCFWMGLFSHWVSSQRMF